MFCILPQYLPLFPTKGNIVFWGGEAYSGVLSWCNSHCGGPDKGEDAALNREETERGGAKRASRVLPNRENEYCMMVLQTAEYSPSVAVSRLWHE